ncbi:MFS transporter [Streptomyces sp. HNM0645]|uniref:MFS transporter n=1 Tax=Streptomyces sp. HNM0645 TaxID=2782343 RepID=UPI0024B84469|nr:MFS transporter [Streptomyces sp. HNM0645]MDI9887192.1 MFS transporter [Streptomyces sp. HNM0645]
MPRSTSSWRPAFVRYVVGRGVSTAGTALVNVVLAFAVLTAGGDGFSVGLVLACSVLTQTLLIPVGGVVADRMDRRTVVVLGNAALSAAHGTTGLLLLLAPERVAVWMFAAAAVTTGAAGAAVQPAFQGLVVQLVPPTALQGANASLRLVVNLARIAVPGLGAVLAAAFGHGQVLIAAAVAFGACSAVLAGLRVVTPPRAVGAVLIGAREGWAAFRSRPWLWGYTLAGAVAVPLWLAGYQLLGPLVLSGRADGQAHWGWAVSAFSGCMVLGSLIALRWRPRRVMLACVLVPLVWPLPLAVLAARPELPWLLASMLVSGVSLELAVVFYETARQQQVPEGLIGRVTALSMFGETALVPLAYVLAGTVADRIGSTSVMWVCCTGILAVTVALLPVREVRRLRRLPAAGRGVGAEAPRPSLSGTPD